jgi:hypothetical protein
MFHSMTEHWEQWTSFDKEECGDTRNVVPLHILKVEIHVMLSPYIS